MKAQAESCRNNAASGFTEAETTFNVFGSAANQIVEESDINKSVNSNHLSHSRTWVSLVTKIGLQFVRTA